MKSQILAGGRGLGKFTNGFQGGVHIVHKDKARIVFSRVFSTVQDALMASSQRQKRETLLSLLLWS